MGTKLQCKSYLPGYYSMRDLNEDSNSCSWPFYYGRKTLTNGQQYYNGNISDAYPEHDKDVVKQTMIEHEAIFKKQVYELHRVYRIQRDLMNDIKRQELSLSSSPLASHITSEDARKSCKRGRGTQSGVFQSRNGVDLTDFGRPTKARRKTIDLDLPADEYIDTDEAEEFRDDLVSGLTSYAPKTEPRTGEKRFMFENSHAGSVLRYGDGLADLNEPIRQIEQTNVFRNNNPKGHTLCYEEIQGHGPSVGSRTQIRGLPTDMSLSSCRVSNKGALNKLHSDKNGSGMGWFSNVLGPGHSRTVEPTVSQRFQHEKSPPDKTKVESWRDRTFHGLETETSAGKRKISSSQRYIHEEPGMSSNVATSYTNSPPDLTRSSSHHDLTRSSSHHRVTSCENSSINLLVQKSISAAAQTDHHPFNGSQITSQRNEISMWPFNESSSRANSSYVTEVPNRNGFHLPPISYDYPKRRNDGLTVERFKNNDSSKIQNGSSCIESIPDPTLNAVLSNSSNVESGQQRVVVTNTSDRERNHEGDLVVLPWLRSKPSRNNEKFDRSDSSFLKNTLTYEDCDVKGLEITCIRKSSPSVSCVNNRETGRFELSGCPSSSKRILGFSVFDKPYVSTDTSNNAKRIVVDINLPCDLGTDFEHHEEEECSVVEKETDAKITRSIDLNLCLSENDESSFSPVSPRADTNAERVEDVIFRQDEHDDDLTRIAAEAIVDISSSNNQTRELRSGSCDAYVADRDPLHWFADVIDSFGDNLERNVVVGDKGGGQNEGFDFFESMTLKLIESTEEEYMPKPLVPESLKLDELAAKVSNRTRKGHARRTRQRRDFQRDILPGLTSLSRHEVTEDLQTFGGLMKANGQTWETGRNSSRNGRIRGKKQLIINNMMSSSSSPRAAFVGTSSSCSLVLNIEAGLEDRSLTGWGKTSRRPRRQRFPAAGNPSYVALT